MPNDEKTLEEILKDLRSGYTPPKSVAPPVSEPVSPEGRQAIQVETDEGAIHTYAIDAQNIVYDERNQPVAEFNPQTNEFLELAPEFISEQKAPSLGQEILGGLGAAVEYAVKPFEYLREYYSVPMAANILELLGFADKEEYNAYLAKLGLDAEAVKTTETFAKAKGWLPEEWDTWGGTPLMPSTKKIEWWREHPEVWVRAKSELAPITEELRRLRIGAYHRREMPWGVKGAMELGVELPLWLAIPTIAGTSRTLSKIPYVGNRLASIFSPAVKAEQLAGRAIAYPVKKVTQKLTERQIERNLINMFKKLPTDSELRAAVTPDWYKAVAKELAHIPGMKGIIRRIDATAVASTDVEKAILRHLGLLEATSNKGNAIMTLLERYGDDITLFGVNERGICAKVVARAKYKGKVPALGDVLEHPNWWVLSKEQLKYVKTLHKLTDSVGAMLKAEGIAIREIPFEEGAHYVHRVVMGKEAPEGLLLFRMGSRRLGAKVSFEKTRFYEFMIEGIENKVVYGRSANQYFRTYYDGAMKMIADKRLAEAIPGMTILERMPLRIRTQAIADVQVVRNMRRLVDRLVKIKADWKAPPITLKAIDRWDETMGIELGRILAMPIGKERTSAMASLIKRAKEILAVAGDKQRISRAAYRKAKERAAVLKPTEAYIAQPAFQGRIYPKETAETIRKYYGETASGWIKGVSSFSSASRTMVATADFSAPFIQGLPVMGHSPHIWAKSTAIQFVSFFDKKVYTNYLMKHGITTQEMATHKCVVMGGGQMHEMVEALPIIARHLHRIPKIGNLLEKAFSETFGRFGVAFTSFGDASRIMLWESMKKGWVRNGQSLDEMARVINHMTGVMSTKAIGITAGQRAVENAFVFFAPRYTRAGFALFGDMLKGGLTSRETIRAIGGFLAGGTAFYVGTCAALGQEPNLDPTSGRFMTIKVGNQHLGIGGFITSMVRFGADVTASIASLGENEPLDFISLDRYKNPIIRVLFGKSAPATSLISGLLTRKDFLGRAIESPEDWTRYLADFAIPIALQTITTQETRANWQAFLVEELGGRTFPEGTWEKVTELRNKLATEEYGVKYNELDLHDKRMLDKAHPEINQLVLEAKAQWANWYPEDLRVIYEGAIDEADALYSDQLWASTQELELGLNTTARFIDKVDDFSLEHASRIDEIRKANPDVIAQFDRWRERDKEDVLVFDEAYSEYIETMVLPSWQDEFYTFQWDAYREATNSFKAKWGEQVYQEVREALWLDDDIPPLFLELKASRELWHDYYSVPESDAQAKERIEVRKTNPFLDATLFFWGRVTTLQSKEAVIWANALMEKYNIDPKAVPSFMKEMKKHHISVGVGGQFPEKYEPVIRRTEEDILRLLGE